jgi:hypothetical protein
MAISHRHQPLVYPDYVNPLPADDIIKIGAVKQDLYDKNYAKIQNHINELDEYGLELVRDVDKKYFSQEMDKYMKAVNESVGKTDFANMANVRGILSISRPLENDPLILNSVKSSQELRRRQKTLAGLKPDERNPANEWVYMQDVYDWKDNPEVGAQLEANKDYIPFADPSEYMQNIVGKVKEDIYTEIVKDGRYTETRDIQEVTSRKLKEWMEANLPQQYKQQIMIDAMYTAKDVDPGLMANHYFDTRQAQLAQVERKIQAYETLGSRLTPPQVKEFQRLALQKQVLEDNLNNLPKSPEQAYKAWVNDHYNAYITNEADLYAYRQEKRKLEADPFSLADYNSSLRRSEAYYRDITLEQEQQRLGLGKYAEESAAGEGLTGPTGEKLTKKELKEVIAQQQNVDKAFKKYTNNLTKSESWEPVDVTRLTGDEEDLLKESLNEAMHLYKDEARANKGDIKKWEDIPASSEIDLSKVQVKRQKGKGGRDTFIFRVDTGENNVIHEIWQDKFDEGIRNRSGLADYNADFAYSMATGEGRNVVQSPDSETAKNYNVETKDQLDTGAVRRFWEQRKKDLSSLE